MKNSNDTIGNRTRDLPVCSAVPQLTALRRAPLKLTAMTKILETCIGSSMILRRVTSLELISLQTIKVSRFIETINSYRKVGLVNVELISMPLEMFLMMGLVTLSESLETYFSTADSFKKFIISKILRVWCCRVCLPLLTFS
jgi:hypothetical protein